MSDSATRRAYGKRKRLRPLLTELARLLQLRRQLAVLEWEHDRRLMQRVAVVGGLGAVFALVGLPLLVTAAAHALARAVDGIDVGTWCLVLGGGLTLPGLTLLVLAVRKLRADFCGLHGTLAELNEDGIWLREWIERVDAETDASAGD